ncbi:DUF1707 domain-containing protein [Streptomyces sp. DSM 44917]|uniref:DUF1707 domain-containing protein n=1 Tax=Streptomyces boetiae TaxID=3075541 RepID=A0ABU2LD79_9ACTN|nr:DUF1707 domain-containing protein [Streptomyces sp. DSM 44917]MDT0309247.1 DUF1707 domain-containing protein [Streptomyces sp. DSM 44917]
MTAAEVPEPASPPSVRASHAEREAVVERLRDAAAEGRLEVEELTQRVERALTATTRADLDSLTADLPPPPAELAPPLVLKGGLHGASREGRWTVPPHITAHGGMGGVKLDFTRVEARPTEIVVEAYGEMAGVVLVLPDGWAADTTGIDPGLGGVRDRTTPERAPGAPLVRVVGAAGMAGVVVRHPGRWERRKLRRNPPH